MGFVDPTSTYSLYDVLNGDLGLNEHGQPEDVVDFYGLLVTPIGEGPTYTVVYEGHTRQLMTFTPDDYDDVMELAVDLFDHVLAISNREGSGLYEYAGKRITYNAEKAEEEPDKFMLVQEADESFGG